MWQLMYQLLKPNPLSESGWTKDSRWTCKCRGVGGQFPAPYTMPPIDSSANGSRKPTLLGGHNTPCFPSSAYCTRTLSRAEPWPALVELTSVNATTQAGRLG